MGHFGLKPIRLAWFYLVFPALLLNYFGQGALLLSDPQAIANPFYLLEKFYGNMTIQEYRKMLKTEHMLLVIDKPLTRILPELHEDNEDIVLNIYGGSKNNSTVNNGVYKVKRQSEKTQGPSKTTIMRDKFGLNSAKK